MLVMWIIFKVNDFCFHHQRAWIITFASEGSVLRWDSAWGTVWDRRQRLLGAYSITRPIYYYFLCELYTQSEPWIYDPEIKNRMLHGMTEPARRPPPPSSVVNVLFWNRSLMGKRWNFPFSFVARCSHGIKFCPMRLRSSYPAKGEGRLFCFSSLCHLEGRY